MDFRWAVGFLPSWSKTIKVIRGPVSDPSLRARLRLATAVGRRFPTGSMHALDTLRLTEDTIPRSRFRVQQQPRNRVRVRTKVSGSDLADHFAPIIRFPGRTGVVFPNPFAGAVEQFGLRGFEDPLEACRIVFAGIARVNLDASSLSIER